MLTVGSNIIDRTHTVVKRFLFCKRLLTLFCAMTEPPKSVIAALLDTNAAPVVQGSFKYQYKYKYCCQKCVNTLQAGNYMFKNKFSLQDIDTDSSSESQKDDDDDEDEAIRMRAMWMKQYEDETKRKMPQQPDHPPPQKMLRSLAIATAMPVFTSTWTPNMTRCSRVQT
jgi:hypothetical protein